MYLNIFILQKINVLIVKDISTNGIHNDYMFVKKKGISKIALYSLNYIITNHHAMHNNYILYAYFFQIVKISSLTIPIPHSVPHQGFN